MINEFIEQNEHYFDSNSSTKNCLVQKADANYLNLHLNNEGLKASKNNINNLNNYSDEEDENRHFLSSSFDLKSKQKSRRSLPSQILFKRIIQPNNQQQTFCPLINCDNDNTIAYKQHRSLSLKGANSAFYNLDSSNAPLNEIYSNNENYSSQKNEENFPTETKATIEDRAKDEESSISKIANKTSDYESGESPTNSDYNSDTDKFKHNPHNLSQIHNQKPGEECLSCNQQYHELVSAKRLEEIKEEFILSSVAESSPNYKKSDKQFKSILNYSNKKLWKEDDLKQIELLNYIHDWSFPIFELYEISKQNVLSHVINFRILFFS